MRWWVKRGLTVDNCQVEYYVTVANSEMMNCNKNLLCDTVNLNMERTKISTESYSLLMPEELKAVELESRVICV